ncbi:MAG TPA: putative lipid II flippase FtsW [Candidatus Paceibacterota bacterium]|nr:putative lipid II flippase FtsW [Candidatus Paceibacterota bacterium]
MGKLKSIDRQFFISTLILIGVGLLIFWSASLGLLARDSVRFGSIAFKQVFVGLIPGLIAVFIFSRVQPDFWRKYSFYIFIGTLLLNVLVFIPGIGLSHGGATRWLLIGSFSFQPSEVLKIASILYFATWLSEVKDEVRTFKYGLVPLLVLLSITGGILLAQPDTDTFVVIAFGLVAMFIASGARLKDFLVLICIGACALSLLAFTRPYIMSRIMTFINPAENSQGSGYQIQQSLIAIGSGGLFGRGFGQSVQKFNYLPEPVGDSIFAVAGEEFGFVGTTMLIAVFTFFALRALLLATRLASQFSSLVMVGLTSYLIVQAFINIGSMIGVIPVSGITLPFVSQGSSALLLSLCSVGIMLSISRYAKPSLK